MPLVIRKNASPSRKQDPVYTGNYGITRHQPHSLRNISLGFHTHLTLHPASNMPTTAPHTLRLLTYLVPGLPLELYQTYQHYLEEALGCPVSLAVESRWSGPPRDRKDPFTEDLVDLGR